MSRFKFTLKAWPVIFLITVTLSYLTQAVAGWFGINLPEQTNIELVKRCAGWNWRFAFIVAQVIVILPIFEEFVFRYLLFRLPAWKMTSKCPIIALASVSAVLFSAAHYIQMPFPDNAFIALVFFGLAQCWLYQRTERIWCAMANHALFNLTNLILLFILPTP